MSLTGPWQYSCPPYFCALKFVNLAFESIYSCQNASTRKFLQMKEKKDSINEQPENINDLQAGIDINSDENQIGTTHLTDPVVNEPEINKLVEENQELKDKYLRQAAEFDNYRKRNARERLELIQTAGRDIITSLLEVLDDAKRAQQQINSSEDVEALKEGMKLILNKLQNILTNKGLKPMNSLHQPFDADLHEAITEIPAPEEKLKGKVIDVLEEGYYLNEKIIRYAKVVVGK